MLPARALNRQRGVAVRTAEGQVSAAAARARVLVFDQRGGDSYNIRGREMSSRLAT